MTHLRLESVDITELLEGVREYYDASAADAGVVLTGPRSSGGGEPVIVQLDRTLVQRAIGNLVSNAVAHTPEGGSVVMETHAESTNVLIEISDTGVGIPADALPRVFDRFFRVDPSRSKASGGTGLGLSIVQGIMQLHRGGVEIASKPGLGTKVTLRMPIGRRPE